MISATDDIVDVAREYVAPLVQPGDVVVERKGGAAYPRGELVTTWTEVKPSLLARILKRGDSCL